MNILQALKQAANFIEKETDQSQQESKIEAEHIFMFVLQINKAKLYERHDDILKEDCYKKINRFLESRKNKPLSHILNKHIFYKEEFYVNENVLIPRPETESIIDEVLRQGDILFKEKKRCIFLDAGTGSGCVGITIANERPAWKILLLDFYSKVIDVVRINLKVSRNNNIHVICSDWLEPISKCSLDFIFSNPPYIKINDTSVEKSVKNNEPNTSLFSGEDGLDDIKKIITYSQKTLSKTGILFLENGIKQSDDILVQLESHDFTDIRVHLDYNGCDRFTSSRKKNG